MIAAEQLESTRNSHAGAKIAVLVPCYNEEATVVAVVTSFLAALPSAKVYVYDNNSTDRTITAATDAGAIVRTEARQGKGNVIRRMFADIEADVYVMVDGGHTTTPPLRRSWWHAVSLIASISLMSAGSG